MDIGIIGTGNIATFLLEAIEQDKRFSHLKITSIFGRNKKAGDQLSGTFQAQFTNDFDNFLKKPFDVVVEAASVEAATQYTAKVLQAGNNIILSSVGVLANQTFYREVEEIANKKDRYIYVPSGAIGGMDAIKGAAVLGGLQEVSLTTRKPPESFGIHQKQESETIIYQGSALNAICEFPKNINVSIILSLAGIGVENTKVTMIADPHITKNTHQIEAVGTFGKLTTVIENEPMPKNAKTSYLAALSILSMLQDKNEQIKIGS